jgi:hypothetical protein
MANGIGCFTHANGMIGLCQWAPVLVRSPLGCFMRPWPWCLPWARACYRFGASFAIWQRGSEGIATRRNHSDRSEGCLAIGTILPEALGSGACQRQVEMS